MADKTLLELAENIDIHVDEHFMCLEKTSVDFFSIGYDEKRGNRAIFFINGNSDFDRALEVTFHGLPNKGLYPEELEKFEKELNKEVSSERFQKIYTEYMELYGEIGKNGINVGTEKLDRFVNLEKEFLKDFEKLRKEHCNMVTAEKEVKASLAPKKRKTNKLVKNDLSEGR